MSLYLITWPRASLEPFKQGLLVIVQQVGLVMRLPLRDPARHVYRFHELMLEEEAVMLAYASPL